MHTYIAYVFTGVCLSVAGCFCKGVCPGCFVRKALSGLFLFVPLLSEYIRYNIKLNITFNFRFCMYNFLKHDVTCSWTPHPPVTNCHTFSDPLPSSVTHFMDGPRGAFCASL